MNDTPIDTKIKAGLKAQAKLIANVILYTLAKPHDQPIPDDRAKEMADAVYTALYSLQYQEQSNSAYEYLKFHAQEMAYCEWEPELIQGVGADV
jgi:hypothetical protein